MINFTRPWNSTGKLDFAADDSSAPKYALKITGIAPDVVSSGVLSQTYSFTIAGLATKPESAQAFVTVIQFGVAAIASQATSQQHFEQIHQFGMVGVCASVISAGELVNDINVFRGPTSAVLSASNQSTKIHKSHVDVFMQSPNLQQNFEHHVIAADRLSVNVDTYQRDLDALVGNLDITVENAESLQNGIISINNELDNANAMACVMFSPGDDVCNGINTNYNYPPRATNRVSSTWQHSEAINKQANTDFSHGVLIKKNYCSYFEHGALASGTRAAIIEPPIEPPKALSPALNFLELWNNKGKLDFLKIELDALIVNNIFNVYHVNQTTGEKTIIKPINSSLAFNIDSFVYTFTGSLLGDSNLEYLKQDTTGAQMLEVYINGYTLRFLVRTYGRTKELGGNSFNFTAVSSSQFLSDPWASKSSVTNSDVISAYQLVSEQAPNFTINTENALDWNLEPNSINESSVTPMGLLNSILTASGAIAIPDLMEDKLYVQPRYKVSSWNWNSLIDDDCDHIIHESAIAVESGENIESPELTSVLISGEKHGVVTMVKRQGTDGLNLAEDVVTTFSQDHNVNAELARNIFSDSGNQEIYGITLPLLPPGESFGLCLPGDIVRLKYDNGAVETGMCLDNGLSASSVSNIWQSVKLELNHGYS